MDLFFVWFVVASVSLFINYIAWEHGSKDRFATGILVGGILVWLMSLTFLILAPIVL